MKHVPFELVFQIPMFEIFWNSRSNIFIFYKLESVWILKNNWNKGKGLNGPSRRHGELRISTLPLLLATMWSEKRCQPRAPLFGEPLYEYRARSRSPTSRRWLLQDARRACTTTIIRALGVLPCPGLATLVGWSALLWTERADLRPLWGPTTWSPWGGRWPLFGWAVVRFRSSGQGIKEIPFSFSKIC
jgi:hypothetical protein